MISRRHSGEFAAGGEHNYPWPEGGQVERWDILPHPADLVLCRGSQRSICSPRGAVTAFRKRSAEVKDSIGFSGLSQLRTVHVGFIWRPIAFAPARGELE
jgi:hypothetical protein